MEEDIYDLTRPVLNEDLRLGLVVWSTLMHAKMEVSALTDQVVQLKLLTGGGPVTLHRGVLSRNSTMFYHLKQVQSDELMELRAMAYVLIATGNTLLEKLNALMEKRA